MMQQTLRLSDGRNARMLVAGRGDPVLLIHGVGMRAEVWGPQIAALSSTHRVMAVDMPGHGESDALPERPALQDFVGWGSRVLEQVGPASVVGHSMGALIAAGLAVERPDLVTRVALICGVYKRNAAARAAVLVRAAEIAAGAADVTGPLDRWFAADQGDLRAQVAGWLRAVPRAGYAAAYGAFAEGDRVYADRLAQVRCPLLAMTADGDANSTPEMSAAMAAMAPQGRAVVIKGHRHMVTLTAPDAVNAGLRDWLAMQEVVA
jgi:(E)-2-((N-methylformamido)methylene)succinate hydrolase